MYINTADHPIGCVDVKKVHKIFIFWNRHFLDNSNGLTVPVNLLVRIGMLNSWRELSKLVFSRINTVRLCVVLVSINKRLGDSLTKCDKIDFQESLHQEGQTSLVLAFFSLLFQIRHIEMAASSVDSVLKCHSFYQPNLIQAFIALCF